jgi:hypothetical protein
VLLESSCTLTDRANMVVVQLSPSPRCTLKAALLRLRTVNLSRRERSERPYLKQREAKAHGWVGEGKGRDASLWSDAGAAHSKDAAADAVWAEHLSSIEPENTSEVYNRRDDILDSFRQKGFVTNDSDAIPVLLLPTGSAGEEGLGHLDVTRHSDLRVSLKRFVEQCSRCFEIIWSGAID